MLRNLDKDLNKPCADTQIWLTLQDIHLTLDQEQYWVVRGMLDHNLGEPMPEFVRPEFLKHLEEFTESDKERTTRKFGAWEGMYINLAMKRVKIELGYGCRFENKEKYQPHVLCDFEDCVLEFTGKSDGSKKTELKCKEFGAVDVKNPDRPLIYQRVLSGEIDDSVECDMLALIFETDDVGQIEFSVILYKMRLYMRTGWKMSQIVIF